MALMNQIAQLILQQGGISAQQLQAIATAQARAQQLTGQSLAQAQQQSGQIWGNALQRLGQLPMQGYQQYQQYLKLFPPTALAPTTFGPSMPSVYTPSSPTWASTLISPEDY